MLFGWTTGNRARHSARVSFFLALLAAWFGGAPGMAATVERIDVAQDRITIRFDDAVERASSFVLGGPYRIAVDVEGASPGRAAMRAGRWHRYARARRRADRRPSCSTWSAPRSLPRASSGMAGACSP